MPQPGSSEWTTWTNLGILAHLGTETDLAGLQSSQTPAAAGGTPAPPPSSGSGSNTGGIVGGVFAGVVVSAAALLFVRKRRAARSSSSLPVDAGAAAKVQGHSTPLEHTSANPAGIELEPTSSNPIVGIPVTADASAAGKAAPCSSCGAASTGQQFCATCGAKA
jgi:hypothetical protein